MSPSPVERHLSQATLDAYLASPARSTVPIEGVPPAQLQIDPCAHEIALDIEWAGDPIAVLDRYEHLKFSTVHHSGRSWARIGVQGREIIPEAYPVLCAIADRVHISEMTLDHAVGDVLANFHHLLETIGRLSPEREIGLFGELLMLSNVVRRIGSAAGLAAWVGPIGGEHDFALAEEDVEVKTTTAEERHHWIGSLSQLVATGSRELHLVSLQLTDAGTSVLGMTLPELVTTVRERLELPEQGRFNAVVRDSGYHDEASSQYRRRFALRSAPLALTVGGTFPRLTADILRLGGARLERLPEVRYVVDLDGLDGNEYELVADFLFPGAPNE